MSDDLASTPFRPPAPARSAVTQPAWYWVVANHSGEVYSSADLGYVPDTDSAYADWLAAGNIASNILSDGELADVLTKWGREGAVVLNTQPTDWGACTAADITAAMQAAGVKISSTATPSLDAHYQLHGPFDAMGRTAIYVSSYDQLPNNQPLVWPTYDATVTFNTAAEFSAIYQVLQDYYNAWQAYATSGGTMPAWGSKTIP